MARVIALYLPQYHPIPENDLWWGRGFTEWTNTGKAKPLFKGHYQPHVPADLGYYDLRVPETRAAQAQMARENGIEAFCYYHYWFAGKRILERPMNEVLQSRQPDFPFCICWANQTWTGVWHGSPNRVLVEQTYPGEADYRAHFQTLAPFFLDSRYLKVNGKPLFVIYRPSDIPDVARVMELWQQMAVEAGLPGLHIVATIHGKQNWDFRQNGFDAAVKQNLPSLRSQNYVSWRQPIKKLSRIYQEKTGKPTIHQYQDVMFDMLPDPTCDTGVYPCLIPNWDNTPRSKQNGLVLQGSTPELFRAQLKKTLQQTQHLPHEERIIFVKSWNEWAEGNHLEPDLKYGRAYLEVIQQELSA